VHWYPGAVALRAVVGRLHSAAVASAVMPRPSSLLDAITAAGWAIAGEPWLERYPVCVDAVPTPVGTGRWMLADDTGAVPIVPGFWRLAELVSLSRGSPLTIVGEHSSEGILPLTAWSNGYPVVLA
jgi:hypothetical protein